MGNLKKNIMIIKHSWKTLIPTYTKLKCSFPAKKKTLNRLLLQQADAESEIIVLENEKKEI